MGSAARRSIAVLALAGAGFALGALLAPDDPQNPAATTITEPAKRPVIEAHVVSARIPPLAASKARVTPPVATGSTSQPAQAPTATTPSQSPSPSRSGQPSTNSSSQTQSTITKTDTGTSTAIKPPPFDEHTTPTP